MEDLYDDLPTAPRLQSSVGLAAELAAATAEREALEAKLAALRAQGTEGRAAIQDLTQRACVMLVTARLELQRNEARLAEVAKTMEAARSLDRTSGGLPPPLNPPARAFFATKIICL